MIVRAVLGQLLNLASSRRACLLIKWYWHHAALLAEALSLLCSSNFHPFPLNIHVEHLAVHQPMYVCRPNVEVLLSDRT